ncbi:sigma-70 family RNA polymerase sigma factor [uncultured Phocaeicola sp.]|jgi:RNA polymerase sigma factor (sigma-70 family)|uniref:RNA polymerase sigma factor n=1 Tax=uncultured Phocaeicola sp. TaxID=990718 RepID=UPI0015ADB3C2|nr:sigma-70 family RNA polymerase sigma factor [uncultured Phocaeicola sp.]
MSKETLTSTFTELRKGFFRLAMRFLSNQEDADDALQEAFFRLWKHADRIDTPEEAEALTIVTVKNLCIDTLRKRNHLQTVELDESRDNVLTESASDVMERKERFNAVQRIIEQRLTPLQKQILHMKEYEEKDYDEIAASLGMQPPAVRMQLSRARKEIRECYLKQMKQ